MEGRDRLLAGDDDDREDEEAEGHGFEEFEGWEGEKPITVRWRLEKEVPHRLRSGLSMPWAGEHTS